MEVGEVIIHARFAPNGSVVEISERPPTLTPGDWFNLLCERVGTTYQPLSGGRGVFRLTRGKVDSLKAEAGPSAA